MAKTTEKKGKKSKLVKVRTPLFRLSYPHIFEKTEEKEGFKSQYEITMLFDKDTDLKALRVPARKAAEKLFGPKDEWPDNFKWPFRSGDKFKDQEGYAGKVVLKATSKNRPQVLNTDKSVITQEDNDEQELIKAGDYCIATVVVMAYNKGGGKGVSFYLNNIMKMKSGEPFSSRTSAEEDFADVEVEENDAEESDDDSDEDDVGF